MRIFLSLLLIPCLAFGGNHFSPKGPIAVWDTLMGGGILNGGGVWNFDNKLFSYDRVGTNNRNSPFCQGCNVSFGATGSTGPGGAVTVSGTQRINSFTFDYVDIGGNYTLSGGEISCVNYSSCTYTANVSGTIGSVISGSKDLIKQGVQTLTFSGINTYSGNTNVNAGTLEATTNVEAIPGNLIIAAGATGHFNVTGTKTFPNTVSGGGTLKVTAGGPGGMVTTLSGNLSGLIGLFDIFPSAGGGGKIYLNNSTQANTPPIGSTIKLNNAATIFLDKALNYGSNFSLYGGPTGEALGQLRVENGTVTGPVTLFANSTIGTNGPTGFISGEISGVGFGFTKEGSGNITLTNNNTYTGTTIISAGILQLGDGTKTNNIIPATNLITDNAALIYNTPSNISHSGVISGTGTFNKQGMGTFSLTAINTYTGTTAVNAGALQISNGTTGTLGNNSNTSVALGATLIFNQDLATSYTYAGTLTGSGTVLKNNTSNQVLLSGNNSAFAGVVNTTSGIIRVVNSNSGSALASWNFSNGAGLALNVANTSYSFGSISGDGSIFAGGAVNGTTLIEGALNTDTTFSGPIDSAGTTMSVTKMGTGIWTLTGAHLYTGTTTVNGGTLQIGGAGSLNSGSYAGAISISGGATLQYSSSAAQTLSGAISSAGNIVKDTGTNTLSVTNNNTAFTGSVTVTKGTFHALYPACLGSGTTTVGSGSTLTLGDNNVSQTWTNPIVFAGPDTGTNALLLSPSMNFQFWDSQITGAITLNTPTTFQNTRAARSVTYQGPISGPSSLTSVGGFTHTFSGNNTYTGGTIIRSGQVVSTHDDALGSGTITLGDAGTGGSGIEWSFAGGGGGNGPPNNVVTGPGTGGVTIGSNSGGYTTLTGTMTFNRAVTLRDSTNDRTTINGKISGNVGTITITGKRVTFGNSANNFVGNIAVSDGSIYQSDHSGALPNTTGITLNGTGIYQVSNGGTHLIGWLSSSSTTSVVQIPSGMVAATLSIGTEGAHQFDGVIANGGAVLSVVIRAGTGRMDIYGHNTYTGGTTVNGYLRINQLDGAGTGPITINAGGTLDCWNLNIPNTITVNPGGTLFNCS